MVSGVVRLDWFCWIEGKRASYLTSQQNPIPHPSSNPTQIETRRVQFFKLADIFLASGLVPAYTAAAFAKRFSRLSLRAPPAGAMVAVGFIHNLIRRHPSCMVLLHRPTPVTGPPAPGVTGASSDGASPGDDPYNESEPDPAHSRAVESSLWEIEALRNHYCPLVSTFVTVLDKDLGERAHTSEVDLEPLLSASYSSMITAEAGRRLKAAPVAFYGRAPEGLFGGGVADEGGRGVEVAAAGAGNAALVRGLPGWDLGAQPSG